MLEVSHGAGRDALCIISNRGRLPGAGGRFVLVCRDAGWKFPCRRSQKSPSHAHPTTTFQLPLAGAPHSSLSPLRRPVPGNMAKNVSSNGKAKVAPKSPTTSGKLKSSPPSPYSTPPPALRSFLETLNPKHIYITHVDNHPVGLKKRVFIFTLLINVFIGGLLVWRAQVVLPWYATVLMAMWGYDNEHKVDIPKSGLNGVLNEGMARGFTFFVDFALAKFLLPWPMSFFLGPSNPTSWRRNVGFQEKEIGVRKSRFWDQQLPKDWLAEEADGTVYKERIMPAIDRNWVKAKTSYLMMDKSWDLDYAGMVTAHKLVESGKNSLTDFQKTVYVYSEDHGWLVWQVYKLDEGAEDGGRKKIVMFKDKLTAMGKESLFFRWIELIQFETLQPGGFNKERQKHTMKLAKDLFEAEGVDFDRFWQEIGGTKGLPGMDVES